MVPFLQRAGLLGEQVTDEQRALLEAAAPLVQERMTKLVEVVDMLGFLFVDDAAFRIDPADGEKLLNEDGKAVVKAAHEALSGLPEWETAGDRRGPPGRADRGPGAQAPQRVRPGAGRGDGAPGLAAAVRVAGAARSRALAGPARRRPAGLRRQVMEVAEA